MWLNVLPHLPLRTATAFVGLRKDGRVDLFLKDTYKSSFASPDAAAYLIYKHIKSQTDVKLHDAEVHFIILGTESAKQWKLMSLPTFASRIGFRYRAGQPPHLPGEDDDSGVGPDDFE